jgi:4'-phosphopantetheinyl transferase EntD
MEPITIYHDPSIQIIICQLAEDIQQVDFLTETELNEFSIIQHHQRKKEYLSIRNILRKIGIKASIIYEGRKPSLPGNLHLSISHSKQFAGLAISKFPCGFDIESISERALRVKDKYLTEKEIQLAQDDITLHNLFWSIKESVYKWDNSHKDFRKSIQIISIDNLKSKVRIETKQGEMIVNYRIIDKTSVLSWIH